MARTLDDLQQLLTARGYPCRKVFDAFVVTTCPTRDYTNPAGTRSIEVHLGFDEKHGCLTLHAPWAFDSRQAAHKEAMLACLLTAAGGSPMVKTQLDPEDGEVRLRIDCRLGDDGVAGDDVLQMLGLIPAFADRWYPHIKDAMDKGEFDTAAARLSATDDRLGSIARRAGGVNRIAALMRAWKRPGDGATGGGGPETSAN